jgi:4-hydroxythreonine-4-phosphate dehydrogenase
MKPRIGILLGDPAGVGPELVAKLLSSRRPGRTASVVVIGDRSVFDEGQRVAGVRVELENISDITEVPLHRDAVFFHLPAAVVGKVVPGRVSVEAGTSALVATRFALKQVKDGKLDGILFAPFNKEALKLAGSPHRTELALFAEELGCPVPSGEINVLRNLWTSRVTAHVPLSEVASQVTRERVLHTIRFLNSALRKYGVQAPRIAVAALNPHASDGGLFGSEERTEIGPAIQDANAEGIAAFGPFPADTIFNRVKPEHYDGIVSMFHDQGQIATKLLGFDMGVTVCGGLPVPIATPAHGTAFEIAGKGVARPGAIKEAFRLITRLAAGNLKASPR